MHEVVILLSITLIYSICELFDGGDCTFNNVYIHLHKIRITSPGIDSLRLNYEAHNSCAAIKLYTSDKHELLFYVCNQVIIQYYLC